MISATFRAAPALAVREYSAPWLCCYWMPRAGVQRAMVVLSLHAARQQHRLSELPWTCMLDFGGLWYPLFSQKLILAWIPHNHAHRFHQMGLPV